MSTPHDMPVLYAPPSVPTQNTTDTASTFREQTCSLGGGTLLCRGAPGNTGCVHVVDGMGEPWTEGL